MRINRRLIYKHFDIKRYWLYRGYAYEADETGCTCQKIKKNEVV